MTTSRLWRYRKLLLLFLLLSFVIIMAAWVYLKPYEPDMHAMQAMKTSDAVQVTSTDAWIRFTPKQQASPSVIFYPGGLVRPESYAPLAQALALKGHQTYVAKMPFHLAVLAGNRAEDILLEQPVDHFVIGGHSLGGVMAARYAAAHPERIIGVYFLGSYPDAKGSLRERNLPVLSLMGSLDGLVDREVYESAKQYVPGAAQFALIQGGNHSQFGSYGLQKGDLPASISSESQIQVTVHYIIEWLRSFSTHE
jgi:pimeloyl-ACP methyl ester carboxylesterase